MSGVVGNAHITPMRESWSPPCLPIKDLRISYKDSLSLPEVLRRLRR